jgi:hypothetical protein
MQENFIVEFDKKTFIVEFELGIECEIKDAGLVG